MDHYTQQTMKKVPFLSAFLILWLCSCAQHPKVPQAAQDAFARKFPNASKVRWGKENATEYEAEFSMNGVDVSANFNKTGEWLETETSMPFTDLPDPVRSAVKAKYPDASISLAEKIEHPGSVLYEVHLKSHGKKIELEVNPDGSIAG